MPALFLLLFIILVQRVLDLMLRLRGGRLRDEDRLRFYASSLRLFLAARAMMLFSLLWEGYPWKVQTGISSVVGVAGIIVVAAMAFRRTGQRSVRGPTPAFIATAIEIISLCLVLRTPATLLLFLPVVLATLDIRRRLAAQAPPRQPWRPRLRPARSHSSG